MNLTLETVRTLLSQASKERNTDYTVPHRGRVMLGTQLLNSPTVARILLETMKVPFKDITTSYWRDGEFVVEYL